jgi:hypothetical protein
MVLVIMLIALCYQIYKVWNPEPPPPPPNHPPASTDVADKVDIPQPPPPKPLNTPEDITSILKNPFTRMTGTAEVTTTEENIELLKIIVWSDGSLRAQLRTSQDTGYYKEGEAFSTFEVLSIDQEAGTVEVYSAESNRRLTLSVGQ